MAQNQPPTQLDKAWWQSAIWQSLWVMAFSPYVVPGTCEEKPLSEGLEAERSQPW